MLALLQLPDSLWSGLVTTGPIGLAVLATVVLFLKYLKEHDQLFLDSQKNMATQLEAVTHELARVVDRLDRAEFRQTRQREEAG